MGCTKDETDIPRSRLPRTSAFCLWSKQIVSACKKHAPVNCRGVKIGRLQCTEIQGRKVDVRWVFVYLRRIDSAKVFPFSELIIFVTLLKNDKLMLIRRKCKRFHLYFAKIARYSHVSWASGRYNSFTFICMTESYWIKQMHVITSLLFCKCIWEKSTINEKVCSEYYFFVFLFFFYTYATTLVTDMKTCVWEIKEILS